MSVLDYAKAGMYASDANLGVRRGISDPSIMNNAGNRGRGSLLKVGLITGALFVASLSPVEWHKFNSGVTTTGAGVSQWDDASGLGHHLLQGTDAARPPQQADGSILFDGVAQYLKATGYALNQPETIYLLFKQVTWTAGDRIFDGNADNSGGLIQAVASPNLVLRSAAVGVADNVKLAVGAYGAVASVFNGASSICQVNGTAPTTGDAGAGNMGGFTLGTIGAFQTSWSNIQAKEAIVFAAAHDAITRMKLIVYCAGVGNLFI